LRERGITEKMVRLVISMYEDARISVECSIGNTGKLKIRVGVHQGSCLSPLLLIIVMNAMSEHVRREVPWDMLYADDLNVAHKEEAGLQARFSDWQGGTGEQEPKD